MDDDRPLTGQKSDGIVFEATTSPIVISMPKPNWKDFAVSIEEAFKLFRKRSVWVSIFLMTLMHPFKSEKAAILVE